MLAVELRKILGGPKWEEVAWTGENCIIRSFMIGAAHQIFLW